MIQLSDDYTVVASSADAGISQSTLAQIDDLQSNLCKSCRVYCFSLMRNGAVFSTYLGGEEEKREIKKLLSNDMVDELCAKFTEPCIETVIELDSGRDSFRVTGFAICDNDKHIMGLCIMVAFISDALGADSIPGSVETTTGDNYDKTLVLAESLLKHFYHEKFYAIGLERHLSHAESIGKDLEKQLSRNEAITGIISLLESDSQFDEITSDLLSLSGEYLSVDECMVLSVGSDNCVQILSDWSSLEDMSVREYFDGISIDKLPFYNGKSYTVSSDSLMPDAFRDFFVASGINCGVFLPIDVKGSSLIYIAFISVVPRKWSVDELGFAQDTRRVLQTLLIKGIARDSLANSYNTLEAVLENAGFGICVTDIGSSEELFINDRYKNILDDSDDLSSLRRVIDEAPRGLGHISNCHARNSDKWFDITLNEIDWVDGRAARVATIYDVTVSKRYQQEIERRANIDYLTGLYNRKRCEEDLQHEIFRAKDTSALGALLYIDLDDFKNINDALGHRVGDHLLIEVAKTLDETVGADNRCYRVGGDEFAVLIPTTQYHKLDRICNRIVRTFTTSWEVGDKEYYCTMSMGYVSFPTNGSDVETLLQRADIALSYAKDRGKNRIEAYSENSKVDGVRRLDLEKALRDAVINDCKEFEVYYQPIVRIDEGQPKCCGAEALLRWHSKGFGFMNPAEFIPLAEYLGLIVPIGEYVLRSACTRCKYWNDFGHPEYKVNVNLSVVQLVQKDIVDTVARAIKQSGINPANLTLEVTESLAVNDMGAMNKVLRGLKALGARVALDDFGTGYSSLNHIRSMPLDVIKIDKCFIDGVGDNAFSDAFVKTVSKLADAIDVNVCVEGVEDENQKLALDDMHIQMIQGFLYDKPLPQEEFERKYVN